MAKFLCEGFNTDGPTYEREADNLASVGGHVGQLMADHETVLVYRLLESGQRLLVLRYDVDGFDL